MNLKNKIFLHSIIATCSFLAAFSITSSEITDIEELESLPAVTSKHHDHEEKIEKKSIKTKQPIRLSIQEMIKDEFYKMSEEEVLLKLKEELDPEKLYQNKEYFWKLFKLYADINPNSALYFYIKNMDAVNEKYKKEYHKTNPLISIAASRKLTPKEAYELLKEKQAELLMSGSRFNSALGYCLASMARQDIASSLIEMKSFHDNDPSNFKKAFQESEFYFAGLKTESYYDLMNFIEGIEGIKSSHIMSRWFMKDREAAAAWLKEKDRYKTQTQNERQLLHSWFYEDPKSAVDWCMANHTDDPKIAAGKILEVWSYKEPDQALEWLIKQKSFDISPLLHQQMTKTVKYNPRLVLDNLNLIVEDKTRNEIAKKAYDELLLLAPLEAQEIQSQIFK